MQDIDELNKEPSFPATPFMTYLQAMLSKNIEGLHSNHQNINMDNSRIIIKTVSC